VTLPENQKWLEERVARGDRFAIATDPATLPNAVGGRIPGQPNGYYTAWELDFLKKKGIYVIPMY
jgi:hypothetical protein